MNIVYAFCAIAVTGWVSPEYGEPVVPSRQNPPTQSFTPQQTYPKFANTHPAPAANEGVRRQPKMPLPPTDPRACTMGELPLPPTMSDNGYLPSAARLGPAPSHNSPATAENSEGRSPNHKAFGHIRPAPGLSPYLMLNNSTSNGTVNTYMAYVRPAQEQQQGSQESEQSMNNSEGPSSQPAPTYPRVFLNYGPYFPDYGAGR